MRDMLMFFAYSFEFLEVYLPSQVGRSANTVESYRDTLTLFKRFVTEVRRTRLRDFTFADCTRDLVFAFLGWLKGEGNSDSTRNHRLAGLKGYLAFAADKDVSLESIRLAVLSIRPYPEVQQEKETVSPEQMLLILAQIPKTGKGVRNRMLLLTLYESAARVSEIVTLKIGNLRLDAEYPLIHVYGKGKKERYIQISRNLAATLSDYSKRLDGVTDILFPTRKNGGLTGLSARSVQSMLQQYADEARERDPSIPDRVHPHMLRRSKATTLYQNGTPLEFVSSLLGHAQLETTRIYAKPSMEQMRTEIEKSVPEEDVKAVPLWAGKKEKEARFLGLR